MANEVEKLNSIAILRIEKVNTLTDDNIEKINTLNFLDSNLIHLPSFVLKIIS